MIIAVVIPAYQEEKNIEKVVRGVRDVSCINKIYVIDDGSSDKTAYLASKVGAIVIRHPFNMGVGAALRDGFIRAQEDKIDIIVVMGGDNQDNPNEILRILKPIIDNNYDLVQGSRWFRGGNTVDIPFFRKITTKLYAFTLRVCSGFPFTDGTNGFRAFRTHILDKINLNERWLNHYELEPYLLYKAVKLGLRIIEVGVTKSYSVEDGYTKMIPVLDWWRILKPIIFLKLKMKK